VGQAQALTTTWTKYTKTFTVASINGKTVGAATTNFTILYFWLDAGSGSNSRSGTIGQSSKTVSIAQVQLEVGPLATPFEQRPYGMELALCQRYYYRTSTSGRTGSGYCSTTTAADIYVQFPVSMRIAPTAIEQSGTASQYGVAFGASGANQSAVPSFIASGASVNGADYLATVASGFTVGQGCIGYSNGGYLGWSAEL
jgi:hypothetical protein